MDNSRQIKFRLTRTDPNRPIPFARSIAITDLMGAINLLDTSVNAKMNRLLHHNKYNRELPLKLLLIQATKFCIKNKAAEQN